MRPLIRHIAGVVKSLGQYDCGVGGRAVVNIIKASCGEASMMARCTGKTNLHNLEPQGPRAHARHPRCHRRPAGGQALGTRLRLVQRRWTPAAKRRCGNTVL